MTWNSILPAEQGWKRDPGEMSNFALCSTQLDRSQLACPRSEVIPMSLPERASLDSTVESGSRAP